MTDKWVDYSKWQGRVGKDKLALMKADDVVGVCIGSWHGLDVNPYAQDNLRDARESGLLTATYFILNNRPGAWTVQQAKAACGNEWYHMNFHASDVEVSGITEGILQDALNETERLGGRPLIYTGGWFWNFWAVQLGHTPAFQRYPFWTSLYDGIAAFNINNVRGSGRWVAKQYLGTTAAYGTKVDFNVFDRSWVDMLPEVVSLPDVPAPAPAPEEGELTMGQYEELKASITAWEQNLHRQIEDARAFTQKVRDDIVARLITLEQRVTSSLTSPVAPTPSAQKTYTVQSGDTLGAIAQKFGVDAVRWSEIPNLPAAVRADPRKLQVGTVLVIPW